MDPAIREELIAYLSQFVTAPKLARIHQVVAQRTRHLSVLLEEIYQPHNASACIRSCDCFGIQDVHVIEEHNPYLLNRAITLGSAKWVTLHRYGPDRGSDLSGAIRQLRGAGYRLVAATLRPGASPIHELDLATPTVVCFGNEEAGLSDALHEAAEAYVQIPMVGFTQSFNISVSVAITLYELAGRLRRSQLPWQLPPAEQRQLLYEWIKLATNQGEALVRRFLRDKGLPEDYFATEPA